MLKDRLSRMESQNSLFEQRLRAMKLPVSGYFKRDGKIVACGFDVKDILKPRRENVFPKSVSSHKNEILKSIRKVVEVKTKKKIAVLFSGGPAPGGHNVVAGLFDVLKDHELWGVKGGPGGLLKGNLFKIEAPAIDRIRNSGGFDFLGTDRTKIKSPEQFQKVKEICETHKLNAIVIIGGDDSNTNSAFLAEELFDLGVQVIGVPKTIDGDMQIPHYLPITFGFDTATKMYSQLVGNILKDSSSSLKYWHFVKLMGRSASHVTLEVALQTKVTYAVISEELETKKITFKQLIKTIADVIVERSKKGLNHGVVLIPEGVVEFLDDFKKLLEMTNNLENNKEFDEKQLMKVLDEREKELLQALPERIKEMLFGNKDSHGNLQLSLMPTEDLFIEALEEYLNANHPNVPFSPQKHFFGYEGRCGNPTYFDALYTYHLGLGAGSLVLNNKTGYMITVGDMEKSFQPYAIALSALLDEERRSGKDEMVIKKSLVTINSEAFKFLEKNRRYWSMEDVFNSPGPNQYRDMTDCIMPYVVVLNEGYKDVKINVEFF